MTDNSINALARALMPFTPPGKKLDPTSVANTTDAERNLLTLISEEAEKERESRRAKGGEAQRGLLGQAVDYVDTIDWDEFLQSPDVLSACGKRANLSPIKLLDLVLDKCSPPNWRALFWMRAWYEQLYRDTKDDVTEIVQSLSKLYGEKQVEAARRKAKVAADALHSKPGGSRDKQAAIRAAWASGKYSTRALCAEQECAAIGMSYDTARRALRNTPNPPRS